MSPGLRKKERAPIDFNKNADSRELFSYLMPLVGNGYFQQVYGLINTAVVSRALSVAAVSVIGACAAVTSMQSFIATGLTTGFGMYLIRCFGKGDERLYRQSFTAALTLVGILTVLSVLFVPWGVSFLQGILNISGELREASAAYLRMVILGTGALGVKNLLLRMLEGMGQSSAAGFLASCSVVSHTLILLFCIYGLHMGVSAAALAVLINNLAIALVIYLYMRRKYPRLASLTLPPRGKDTVQIWRELLANGGSKASMMVLVGLGNFVMQSAVNQMPAGQIAGYAYGDSLSNFLLVPLSALATAASASAGQNMGRGNYRQIQAYHKKLMKVHWCACILITALTFLFGKGMIQLLAGKGAAESAVSAGALWVYICIPAFTGLGAAMICRNSLQVMGSYGKLPLLGLLEMGITVVFALFLVPVGGYLAFCLSVGVKWMALGIAAGFWYRKRIQFLLDM